MFYSLSGNLIYKDDSIAVIECNGIAFELLIPLTTAKRLPEINKTVSLFTKMILREDEAYLIGFSSIEDKRLFDSLLTVSGIGPKQGLKILSEMSTQEIRNIIISEDENALSRIKGIGQKTASRIILELKDKIKKLQLGETTPSQDNLEKKKMEVLMALRVLGYTDFEAKRAIEETFKNTEEVQAKSVEDIIKLTLSKMVR